MNFRFHEYDNILIAIEGNEVNDLPLTQVIWWACLYFKQIKGEKPKVAYRSVVEFLKVNVPYFQEAEYVRLIERQIAKAKKYKITNIDHISITQNEMGYIQSFHDARKEKIVFVLIALAKYQNARSNSQKNLVFVKPRDVLQMARVSLPAAEQAPYYSSLYKDGVLQFNTSVGYNMQIVNGVSDDEPVMTLFESDYYDLAYAYLNYKEGGYKRCAQCGRWFKIRKNAPNQRYCNEHKSKSTIYLGLKKIECCDCGNVFFVSSKNNRTKRCQNCQAKYRRKYQKELMKRTREQAKNLNQ